MIFQKQVVTFYLSIVCIFSLFHTVSFFRQEPFVMGHLIYQVFYQEKCELERIVHFEKNDHVLITLNASES